HNLVFSKQFEQTSVRHTDCSHYFRHCAWHASETQTGKGPDMRSAPSNEIEYLGTIEGATAENPRLIREMSRRLDALRRFDQSFCDADCRPHAGVSSWQPDSPNQP